MNLIMIEGFDDLVEILVDTTGREWFGSTFLLIQVMSLVAIEVTAGIATITPLAMNNLCVRIEANSSRWSLASSWLFSRMPMFRIFRNAPLLPSPVAFYSTSRP